MIDISSKESFIRSIMREAQLIGASREVSLWIACQFALESNYGNSRLARSDFNLTGMKSPVLRPSFNLNPARTFCSYPDVEYSVIDYFIWLAWNKCTIAKLQDLNLFKNFIREKRYCSDPDYITSITRLYEKSSHFLTDLNL